MDNQTTLIEVKNSFPRIQSPSSINMFLQCPRKYYYRYHLKLPISSSIHLLRGGVVHSALEEFFTFDIGPISGDNFIFNLHIVLLEHFKKNWQSKMDELSRLGLTKQELDYYYGDSIAMLENWFTSFSGKLFEIAKITSFENAFKMLSPKVELEYVSGKYGVRGFIDAIHEYNGKVTIMDYKTSAKDTMTPEYKLQLAIYALLYEEKHGKKPDQVGISFLKFGDRMLDVDSNLIEFAKNEVLSVHINTASDKIQDYPRHTSPLCKWSSGKCDFYEKCFNGN